MFRLQLKKQYKTTIKITIRDLGRALLNPPRGAKNAQASRVSPGELPGTSRGLMWATWKPSAGLVGSAPQPHGSLLALHKSIWEEQSNNTLNLHDLATSHHPSAWPGGTRKAA